MVGVVGAEGKGLAGLEYGLNDKLSGQDGKAMYEVDAKGNKIPNADHTVEEPKPGVRPRSSPWTRTCSGSRRSGSSRR